MDESITRKSQPDWVLTSLAVLATILGILAIWDAGYARSAVAGQVLPREFWMQGLFAVVSISAAYVCYRIRHETWRRIAVGGLVATIVLLFLVEIPGIGKEIGGAVRWIDLKFFLLQPAEFAKLAVVLFLAYVLAKRKPLPKLKKTPRHIGEKIDWVIMPWLGRVAFLIPVAAIIVLIEMEPDLATAMIIAFATFVMLVVGGVSKKSLALLVICSITVVGAMTIKEPYRMARITNHAHRWDESNIDGPGYQTTQSETALARGGLTGVGLGNGRAKHTLPAPTTDFILATIGEEFGLIGSLVVVGLICAIALRMAMLGFQRKDPFGKLVLVGIASWIGIQAATNVMMANGFFPPIGIPLPFFSYGGSSLLSLWMAIGVAQSILVNRISEKEVLIEDRSHRRRDRWARLPST